ncbi:YggT family protein [Henriciella barbarensis]|uniref:YggT family protein n=1 Tax=Henriciella barbarensis TaxID=86342 RepID=A0A399R7G4_9PROT|nr:YggT family protein [Henriciella barbarensis]RIJ26075.1 YggT family protein [Henriciella barbarensis]
MQHVPPLRAQVEDGRVSRLRQADFSEKRGFPKVNLRSFHIAESRAFSLVRPLKWKEIRPVQDLALALYQYFVYPILTLILFALFAYVIMSWLFTFNVLSPYGQIARQIYSMLESVLEPLLRPIRNTIPPLGQLDLSVFILALLILFFRDWLFPQLLFAMPG